MSAFHRAPLLGRRALLLVAALVIVAALLVVFGGALTRSTDTEARRQQAEAELAILQEVVQSGEAELAFIGTNAYVDAAARRLGYGLPGERRFRLPAGAPSPEPIAPIGPQQREAPPLAPFDAWMELLFGAGPEPSPAPGDSD